MSLNFVIKEDLSSILEIEKSKDCASFIWNPLDIYNALSSNIKISKNALMEFYSSWLSCKTIGDILSVVWNEKMNYWNCLEKAQSNLWYMFDKDSMIIHNKNNSNKVNLLSWIWWDCLTLNFDLYNEFQNSWLLERIRDQTKLVTKLNLYEWTWRTHFIENIWFIHIFIVLEIWPSKYIVDASFGEISILNESGYKTERKIQFTKDYINDSSLGSLNVWIIEFDLWYDWDLKNMNTWQSRVLGVSKNWSYAINHSFVLEKKSWKLLPVVTILNYQWRKCYSYYSPLKNQYFHFSKQWVELDIDTKREVEDIIEYYISII